MITTAEGIKQLYKETYQNRLKPNKIKEGLENLEEMKEKLFEKIMKIASKKKTKDWTKDKLLKVLKHLKKGKARDPHGFIYDIFRPEVAGENLIEGLLLLFNTINDRQEIPEIF